MVTEDQGRKSSCP